MTTLYAWPDDRIAEMSRLWLDGYSASQIAHRLGGGITRNAVIGRVTRMGLRRSETTLSKVGTRLHGERRASRPTLPKPPAPKPDIVIQVLTTMVNPWTGSVRFGDRTSRQCCWPLGDPKLGADMPCCGAPTDPWRRYPYCEFHAGIRVNKEWRTR